MPSIPSWFTKVTALRFSSTNSKPITAFAGGGQTGAYPLVKGVNQIGTVASAGDSVALPVAAQGAMIIVVNTGANTLAVFPNGTDTINGGSASASVNLAANSTGHYISPKSGAWFSASAAVALTGATTGTGSQVLATSPALVTPNLGTPSAGVLTSCTGLPGAGLLSNASFGATGQQVYHAQYSFATDGGAVSTITPANNATIPQNFVITGVGLNSSAAVTSAGSATVSVGLSAGGGSATSLVAATAKASWSANALVQGVPVPQTTSTWIKLSAPAQVTVSVATAALTAGIIEVYVFGYQSGT